MAADPTAAAASEVAEPPDHSATPTATPEADSVDASPAESGSSTQPLEPIPEPESAAEAPATPPNVAAEETDEVAEPLDHAADPLTTPGAAPTDASPAESGSSTEPLDSAEPPALLEPTPADAASSGSGSATQPLDATPEAESNGAAETEDDALEDGIEDGLLPLSDADLECALEALLLVVDSPVEEEALATALNSTPLRVAERLRLLSDKYTDQDRGIDLRRAGGGWRFYTRDRYAPYVEKLLLDGQRAKLTRAALETLAVIAYRQPVTRARVAAVRGVNCDGVIRTLLARGLVEETGTDVETGGFLYRTTELFLERLGLSSLEDLPPIAPLLPEVDSIDEL
jgi:segregation and condensation protein B